MGLHDGRWDLKARLLGVPLVDLLGRVRDTVAIYASGGFTSQSPERLCDQLAGWVDAGITRVKMKVGRDPDDDVARVLTARAAVGNVTWFEEPVTSDDLQGLRLLSNRAPAAMEITAGEYAYDAFDVRRLLETGAVDVLMADATRCGGIELRSDADRYAVADEGPPR